MKWIIYVGICSILALEMSSLAFIPRNLTTPARPKNTEPVARAGNRDHPSSRNVSVSPAASAPDDAPTKYNDQDYANLAALSLSDYALWINADLRKQLEIGAKDEHRCEYPLSYF
jgi:hypothetical protein